MVPCSQSATLLALMLLMAGNAMPPSEPSTIAPNACGGAVRLVVSVFETRVRRPAWCRMELSTQHMRCHVT